MVFGLVRVRISERSTVIVGAGYYLFITLGRKSLEFDNFCIRGRSALNVNKSAYERAAGVREYNFVNFNTGQNSWPILKTVTYTVLCT